MPTDEFTGRTVGHRRVDTDARAPAAPLDIGELERALHELRFELVALSYALSAHLARYGHRQPDDLALSEAAALVVRQLDRVRQRIAAASPRLAGRGPR